MGISIPAFAMGAGQSGQTRLDPYAEDAPLWKANQIQERAAQQQQQSNQQLADTMGAIGTKLPEFMRKFNEQEALTFTMDRRNKMMIEGTKAVADWETTATGENALNAPKALSEKMQSIKEALLKDAPNDLARTRAGQDLDNHIAQFQVHGEKIARKGAKEHTANVINNWEERLLSMAATGGGSPQLQDWILREGEAAWVAQGVNGLLISPEEAQQGIHSFQKKAAWAYVQGQLANPQLQDKIMGELKRGDLKDVFTAEQNIKVMTQMEHIRREREAEARRAQAEAKQRMREAAYDSQEFLKDQVDSAAATGKTAPGTVDAIASLRKMGGNFARHADNMDAAISSSMAVHGTVQSSVFLPFDEQRSKLQALMPGEGEDNYHIKIQAVQRGLSAISNQEDAFKKDPAGFTLPRAFNQVVKFGGDPSKQEDFSRVLGLAVDIQKQMGMPEDKIKVVPLKDAQLLAGKFASGSEDDKLSIIKSLDIYGPLKSKAMAELKIDASAQHASALLDTSDPQSVNNARLLMGVNSDKIKLSDAEEKALKADVIKKSLTPTLLQKQAAFVAQGGAGRSAYAKELEQVGARAASVVGAVKAGQILDAPYTHVDDDKLALALVPKEISEKDAVAGFAALRSSISEDDLADMKAAIIASKGPGVGSRLFQERLNDIRTHGVWMNDGNGFVLLDPVTRQAVAVKGRKAFKVTNSQLKDAAHGRATITGPVMGDMPLFGDK